MIYRRLRRVGDVCVGLFGLIVSSPILVGFSIAIWLEDRESPVFVQQRSGRDGEPFKVYKLRSMSTGTVEAASSEASGSSVTRVGAVARRSNADELPQLWCVLIGTMSLIGPRPALPSQTRLLELRRQNGSDALRPGLTGLAQVSAFDGMTDEEKAAHDGRYVERYGLRVDVEVLLRTLKYLTKPPPKY